MIFDEFSYLCISFMREDKRDLISAMIVPAAFVVLLWIIKILEVTTNISLTQYGLEPRSTTGLIGIITMPLLHSDFSHLSSNTLAVFLLLSGLYLFYKNFASTLFVSFYFFSSLAAWIIGTSGTIHIGASGLVYCLAWFHILSGFLKRNKPQMAFGFLVIFLYGSVVWGIFPMFQSSPRISWQGHLGGAITGIVFAILFKHKGIVHKEVIPLEKEEELSDEDPYWMEGSHEELNQKEEIKESNSTEI